MLPALPPIGVRWDPHTDVSDSSSFESASSPSPPAPQRGSASLGDSEVTLGSQDALKRSVLSASQPPAPATFGGVMLTWGEGMLGQLGQAWLTKSFRAQPKPVSFDEPADNSRVTDISCGWGHTMCVTECGHLYSFGDGMRGQTGHGDASTLHTPRLVGLGFAAVSCGKEHSVALKKDGRMFTFGDGQVGKLGLNHENDQWFPSPVPFTIPAVAVTCGETFSGCLTGDGEVYLWGDGSRGQLANGSFENHRQPSKVPGVNVIVKLSLGRWHGLALTHDGRVLSFGDNVRGQLGRSSNDASLMKEVDISSDGAPEYVSDIAAGSLHSVVMTATGRVFCFGCNQAGAVGISLQTTMQRVRTPTEIVLDGGQEQRLHVVAVAAGGAHTLCVTHEGTVFAWGNGVSVPTMVSLSTKDIRGATPMFTQSAEFAKIETGGTHSAVLLTAKGPRSSPSYPASSPFVEILITCNEEHQLMTSAVIVIDTRKISSLQELLDLARSVFFQQMRLQHKGKFLSSDEEVLQLWKDQNKRIHLEAKRGFGDDFVSLADKAVIFQQGHRATIRHIAGPTFVRLSDNRGLIGLIFTSGDDNLIIAWRMTSSRCHAIFRGHSDGVTGLVVQGSCVYSSSADTTLRRWNARTGLSDLVYQKHVMAVECLVVHERVLYSGSHDCMIYAWDADHAVVLREYRGHMGPVTCLVFLEMHNVLLSSSHDADVIVWSGDKGNLIAKLEGHRNAVTCLSTAPHSSIVLSGSFDGHVRRWNIDSVMASGDTEPTHAYEGAGEAVTALTYTDDFGGYIFVGYRDGLLRSIPLANLRSVASSNPHISKNVHSHTTKKLNQVHPLPKGALGVRIRESRLHRGAIAGIVWDSHSELAYVGDATGGLVGWDRFCRFNRAFQGHPQGVSVLSFYRNNLYTGSEDCTLRCWTTTNVSLVSTLLDFLGDSYQSSDRVYGSFNDIVSFEWKPRVLGPALLLLLLLSVMQMASIPFSMIQHKPETMGPAIEASRGTMLFSEATPSFLRMCVALAAYVVIFLALVAISPVVELQKRRFESAYGSPVTWLVLWAIIWSTCLVGATALLLPVTRMYFEVLTCERIEGHWMNVDFPDVECWEGMHLTFVIILGVEIVGLFCPLAYRLVLVDGMIDRINLDRLVNLVDWRDDESYELRKEHFMSKKRTEFTKAYTLLKLALVAFSTVFRSEVLVLQWILAAGATVPVVHDIFRGEYFSEKVNALQTGANALLLNINIIALFAVLRTDKKSRDTISTAFWVSSPIVFACGMGLHGLVDFCKRRIRKKKAKESLGREEHPSQFAAECYFVTGSTFRGYASQPGVLPHPLILTVESREANRWTGTMRWPSLKDSVTHVHGVVNGSEATFTEAAVLRGSVPIPVNYRITMSGQIARGLNSFPNHPEMDAGPIALEMVTVGQAEEPD